jgi:hypothetical protein
MSYEDARLLQASAKCLMAGAWTLQSQKEITILEWNRRSLGLFRELLDYALPSAGELSTFTMTIS